MDNLMKGDSIVSSREVSKNFGKEHHHVVDAIENNADEVSIRMTDIDLRIKKDTALIVEIDVFRFMKEHGLSYVVVEMNTQGEYECLEEIIVTGEINENKLEKMALNWIFKHVELVDEEEL